jgi:hypothetical protein
LFGKRHRSNCKSSLRLRPLWVLKTALISAHLPPLRWPPWLRFSPQDRKNTERGLVPFHSARHFACVAHRVIDTASFSSLTCPRPSVGGSLLTPLPRPRCGDPKVGARFHLSDIRPQLLVGGSLRIQSGLFSSLPLQRPPCGELLSGLHSKQSRL